MNDFIISDTEALSFFLHLMCYVQDKECEDPKKCLVLELVTFSGMNVFYVPCERLIIEIEQIITLLKNHKPALSLIESFILNIGRFVMDEQYMDKVDIRIVIRDCMTKSKVDDKKGMKSRVGADSFLMDSDKTTNFRYKIVGSSFSDKDIDEINSIESKKDKVIKRVMAIRARGGKLEFDKVDHQIFRNNLRLLDGDLDKIVAELLLAQFDIGTADLKDLVSYISVRNPLGYDEVSSIPYYEYKIKHLLTSTALGMMPGRAWDGKFDANGGYIVVRKDGDIVCYHFYDRNRFEDYLFNNAYLERASITRHDYASIIKENDDLYFKLNCQIRLR